MLPLPVGLLTELTLPLLVGLATLMGVDGGGGRRVVGDLVALAWQKPHFGTVQVVFHPLPHTYLQTLICTETIYTFSVLV